MTTSESAAEIIEKACSAKNWDVNDYEPFDQEGISRLSPHTHTHTHMSAQINIHFRTCTPDAHPHTHSHSHI
jgi:hypothetical protein